MERGIRIFSTLVFLLCVAGVVIGRMTGTVIPNDDYRAPVIGVLGIGALTVTGLFALRIAIRPRQDDAFVWTGATLGVGGIIGLVAWKLSVSAPLAKDVAVLWPAHAFPWIVRAIVATLVIQLVFVVLGSFGGRRVPDAALPAARVVRR